MYIIFSPGGTCQVPLLLSQNHRLSFDEQIHPEVSWILPQHWQGPNIFEVEEGVQLFRRVCSVKDSMRGHLKWRHAERGWKVVLFRCQGIRYRAEEGEGHIYRRFLFCWPYKRWSSYPNKIDNAKWRLSVTFISIYWAAEQNGRAYICIELTKICF